MTAVSGRTRHYGDFYEVQPTRADPRPLLVVWGNCQAEALRVLLSSGHSVPFRSVRVPPVHELESADLPYVQRLAERVSLFVSQPVRTGYRSLPIGTEDIEASLPTGARTLRWPVIRYGGLHPFQAIVRHPSAPSAVPDAVPYHDLRTVMAARARRSPGDRWDHPVDAETITRAARLSIDELRRRETRDTDVAISGAIAPAGADAFHTINHPGNDVLVAMAERVLRALAIDSEVVAPDRHLLGGVRAPVEAGVLDAFGWSGPARTTWIVEGQAISADTVHRAQMHWYAEHPEFIDAALSRHEERLRLLGMLL